MPEEPRCEILSDAGAIAAQRDAWLELHARAPLRAPNADPDRFLASLEPGTEPCVLRIGTPRCLDALVVGRLGTRRIACRIGYLTLPAPRLRCLDVAYGGVMLRPEAGAKLADEVVSALLSRLGSGGVTHLMLNHLPADSPVLAGLRRSLGARALVPVREQHRVFELPREPEAVLGHLSRKHRYNARREDRLLVEHFGGDVRLRTFTGAEQLPALLAGAAEIYDRSYQAGIGGGFRKASVWTRILEVEARLGRLRGYLLEASGRGVAFQVGVVYGGTYHLEATAYLPDWRSLSPGSVLLRRVLEDLVAAKIGKVDYGFGDADYKRTYSTSVREEETLHAYARTVPALAALALDRVALGVASGSRALVERAGGVRALKRRWRRAAERRDRS